MHDIESTMGKTTETAVFRVPGGEIDRRIACLQAAMRQRRMDAVFIVQRMDLFYFSGTAQNGYLLVPADREPTLFVRKYFPRAARESAIGRKVELDSVRGLPGRIADIYGKMPAVLGFEFDVLPVREFRFYRELLRPETCVDGSGLIHRVRAIKSAWDIAQLEQAAQLSRRVFEFVRAQIRPGLGATELFGRCETFARQQGHGARLRRRNWTGEGYLWPGLHRLLHLLSQPPGRHSQLRQRVRG